MAPQHTITHLKPPFNFQTFFREYIKLFNPTRLFHRLLRTSEGRLFTFLVCVALASTACIYTIGAPHETGATWLCCAVWVVLLFLYIVHRGGQKTEAMCREYAGTVTDGCIRNSHDLRKVLCWLALDDGSGNGNSSGTAFPTKCEA